MGFPFLGLPQVILVAVENPKPGVGVGEAVLPRTVANREEVTLFEVGRLVVMDGLDGFLGECEGWQIGGFASGDLGEKLAREA